MKILVAIFSIIFFSACDSHAIEASFILTAQQNIDDQIMSIPQHRAPCFHMLDRIYIQQRVEMMIFFWGQKLDDENKGNVTADIEIIDPNGNRNVLQKDIVISTENVTDPNLVHASKQVFILVFTEGDVLGKYNVIANVHDNNSGESIELPLEAELAEYTPQDTEAQEGNWQDYFLTYYINPQPGRAIAVFINFINHLSFQESLDIKTYIASYYFFAEIFSKNEYLRDHLIKTYDNFNHERKNLALYLFIVMSKYYDYDLSFLNENLIKRIKNTKDPLFYNPHDKPTDGFHQDIHWMRFMANGDIDPIEKIISTLEYSKYAGTIEKYKNSEKTKEAWRDIHREAVFQAGVWSLTSNCTQHELVRNYCEFFYENGNYDENIKTWLYVV